MTFKEYIVEESEPSGSYIAFAQLDTELIIGTYECQDAQEAMNLFFKQTSNFGNKDIQRFCSLMEYNADKSLAGIYKGRCLPRTVISYTSPIFANFDKIKDKLSAHLAFDSITNIHDMELLLLKYVKQTEIIDISKANDSIFNGEFLKELT